MKKILTTLVLLGLMISVFSISYAANNNLEDANYFAFDDYWEKEVPNSEYYYNKVFYSRTLTAAEQLEQLTTKISPDTLLVPSSNVSGKDYFAFFSRSYYNFYTNIDASRVIYAQNPCFYHDGCGDPSIYAFDDVSANSASISGMHFKTCSEFVHGKTTPDEAYIFYYLAPNSNSGSIKTYLNVDDGKLVFSPTKETEWNISWTSNGYKEVYIKTENGLYLTVTEDGLDIKQKRTSIKFHPYRVSDQGSYINCSPYGFKCLKEETGSVSLLPCAGYQNVYYWSTRSVIKSAQSYESYVQNAEQFSKDDPYTFIDASSPYEYSIPKYKCMNLYPVYGGHLHYTIVDENGETVQGAKTFYCPPCSNLNSKYMYYLEESDLILPNSWIAIDMPLSGSSGGYDTKALGVQCYTDGTYTTVDKDMTSRVRIVDGRVVFDGISNDPADYEHREIYIKVVVKKTVAEMLFCASGETYAGPGVTASNEPDPTSKTYTGYGSELVELKAYFWQIIDFTNPDWSGDYTYYWYREIDGVELPIGVTDKDTFTCTLPDVDETTTIKYYCVIRKTHPNTGKYAQITIEPATVTVKPFDVEILDVYTSNKTFGDKIFISVPEGFKCYKNGKSLDVSTSYTPDNLNNGQTSQTVNNLYGFNYEITSNGTYSFRILREINGITRGSKWITVEYDNIIENEEDIGIEITDLYPDYCKSDKVLIEPSSSDILNPLSHIKGCYVKYNDGEWEELDSIVKEYSTDNTEFTVKYRAAGGYDLGYTYIFDKNGKYHFKYVTNSDKEILSEELYYQFHTEPVSLKVTTPSKTIYNIGDKLDTDGMKVICIYDNDTEEDVTNEATVNVPDFDTRGEKTVTVTYQGITTSFSVYVKADISKAVTSLAKTTYTYTGKTIKPTVTVKYNGKKLSLGKDYTVKYSSNTKCGKAKVTITGIGDYKGSVTKYFYIAPGKAKLSKVTAGKKKITLSIKSQKSTGITGYQIYYKKSGSSAKTVYTTSTSKTLSKLTKGKKYTVKVRAYVKIGDKKYFGSYSSSKTVKVK